MQYNQEDASKIYAITHSFKEKKEDSSNYDIEEEKGKTLSSGFKFV